MRKHLLTSLSIVFAACREAPASMDAGDEPNVDAGPDASTPAFDLRLESAPGMPLETHDELGVHYGCQGGAHTNFDVIAEGSRLEEGALVSATMYGRTWEFMMNATDTGAELRGFMFLLEDFIAPQGIALPRNDSLEVRVTRRDGAVVAIEHDVILVFADVCMLECTYVDVPGTAIVREIMPPAVTGCTAVAVQLLIDFTAEGTTETQTRISVAHSIEPDCIEAIGFTLGNTIPAQRRDLLPGTGTCTPFSWSVMPDETPCDAICP